MIQELNPTENDPVLYDPACFRIVDPQEPEFWVCEIGEDGERYCYPPEWSEVGFFEDYLSQHHRHLTDRESTEGRKKRSSDSVKVLMMCQSINEGLQQEEKILVFLRLVEFVKKQWLIIDIPLDQGSGGIVFFTKSYCLLN